MIPHSFLQLCSVRPVVSKGSGFEETAPTNHFLLQKKISAMSKHWYSFTTVDVFTEVPYEGNPLAIVQISKDSEITTEQKLKIAKEFNLSETIFLHEDRDDVEGRQADIFTTQAEIPFAVGPYHCVLIASDFIVDIYRATQPSELFASLHQ